MTQKETEERKGLILGEISYFHNLCCWVSLCGQLHQISSCREITGPFLQSSINTNHCKNTRFKKPGEALQDHTQRQPRDRPRDGGNAGPEHVTSRRLLPYGAAPGSAAACELSSFSLPPLCRPLSSLGLSHRRPGPTEEHVQQQVPGCGRVGGSRFRGRALNIPRAP